MGCKGDAAIAVDCTVSQQEFCFVAGTHHQAAPSHRLIIKRGHAHASHDIAAAQFAHLGEVGNKRIRHLADGYSTMGNCRGLRSRLRRRSSSRQMMFGRACAKASTFSGPSARAEQICGDGRVDPAGQADDGARHAGFGYAIADESRQYAGCEFGIYCQARQYRARSVMSHGRTLVCVL